MFTPWYKAARQHQIARPRRSLPGNLYSGKVGEALSRVAKPGGEPSGFEGGRDAVLELLERLPDLAAVEEWRDFPGKRATSRLSAHLRFGTVSVREVYHRMAKSSGGSDGLVRQLYWRDFYTHIAFHFPHVFKGPFRRRYNKISWSGDDTVFDAWCNGMTGFPMVDAGMRELVSTGYMHNRVRMLTASFLVKNLHVDWRRGEEFFARHLIDFDPAVNNGNWQWAASTGCDAQPYFRVFNPWRQQSRFDPDAEYIRQWLPELASWSAGRIHGLVRDSSGYRAPIVDLGQSVLETKRMFRQAGNVRLPS